MFMKHKLKLIFFLIISFFSISNSYALDTPYFVNGICISKVITFSAVTARPENGLQVNPSQGYVNIYVPVGSDFSYSVQDITGFLIKSPNQRFFYDYRAMTLAPNYWNGYDFAGNTNYLSVGSASKVQEMNFTCGTSGITAPGSLVNQSFITYEAKVTPIISNYSGSISVIGNGFYKSGTSVTLSVPHVSGYVFDRFIGTCNNSTIVPLRNYSTKSLYSYNISNISGNCNLQALYVKEEQFMSVIYHQVTLYSNTGGTVSAGGYNNQTSITFSVRDGDSISFSANASSSYVFSSWSGDLAGEASSGIEFVTSDISATANFTLLSNTTGTTGSCPEASATGLVFTVSPLGSGRLGTHNLPFGVRTAQISSAPWSMPSGYIGSGGGVVWNCSSDGGLATITPIPYSGYVFSSWSGDSTVSTTTLNRLNASNQVSYKDIANSVITANFIYTGELNDNGETPVEIVEPSYTVSNDTVAKLFELNKVGAFSKSPYTIDTKCVNRVLFLSGVRVYDTGLFGLKVSLSSSPKNYRIYTLDGSTVSQKVDGQTLILKSSPSNLIFSSDVNSLSAGDYQSNNTDVFIGQESSLSFKNFVISSKDSNQYSCKNETVETIKSISYFNGSGIRLLNGFSYIPFVTGGKGFVNVSYNDVSTSTVNGFTEMPPTNVNPFSRSIFNASLYSAVNCTFGYNAVSPLDTDVGCPMWLSNNNLYLDQYKYMWVLSSKPVKNFIHEQEEYKYGVNFTFGLTDFFTTGSFGSPLATTTFIKSLAYFPIKKGVVATGTLDHPFINSSSSNVQIYATKIDLSRDKCVLYQTPTDYSNKISNFVSSVFNINTCPKLKTQRYLNHLVFDSVKASTDVVYLYGIYMTSSEEDLTQYSNNDISTKILYTSVIDDSVLDEEIIGGSNIEEDLGDRKKYKDDLVVESSLTKGDSKILSKLSEDIKDKYSISQCTKYGYTTGLLEGFACVIENSVMQLIIKLFIPSSESLESIEKFYAIDDASSSLRTSGAVSAFLSIPIRFKHWSNLDWLPNSTSSIFSDSYFIPRSGYYNYTATTSIDGYWVATTTTPGYWTPVYIATSTYTATSTGGSITLNGTNWVHTFNSSSSFSTNFIGNGSIFIVAGGGGGGASNGVSGGGGGGAGGYISTSSIGFSSTTYTITVGSGGAGGSGSGATGYNGSNSSISIFNLVAIGGGAGAGVSQGTGNSGGSGGGGSSGAGGNGSSGQGYSGATGNTNSIGGGGGGATASGSGGNGGAGYNSSISGSSICYAGGGGGGYSSGNGGSGSCGGGNGGAGYTASIGGTVNRGSGGGGGGTGGAGQNGASGGSGVVIISYNPSVNIPGYWVNQYVATTTNPPYYVATSTLNGFFTYVATSTTDGTFATISSSTLVNGYLTVGFSSSTRYDLKPISLNDYVKYYESADRVFSDYLDFFLSFFLIMFVSYRAYKLILL